MSICNRNRIMTGLRFLFRVTLRRLDLAAEISNHLREPQKVPLVMSPDETKRLLAVASNLKARVLLSLSYGCGLRAGEVVRLKGQAISTARRRSFASSSPRAARIAMSCCHRRRLLCCGNGVRRGPSRYDTGTLRWTNAGCFPAPGRGKPMTTRQLSRLFHEAADAAGINKKAVTLLTRYATASRPICSSAAPTSE